MKSYNPLYDEAIRVSIEWSQPQLITGFKDELVKNPELGYFYKFIGKYSNSNHLVYIGQSYSRFVSDRIKDLDHKIKQNKFNQEHPKIRLHVSVGIIKHIDKFDKKKISDIEKLLIYSHPNSDYKYMINKKATMNHHVNINYQIINSGFLKDRMHEEVYYGLFIK